MNHKVVKNDILWGYLSQFLNMASSLLLLPFILYFLTAEDVGLWYVFVSIIGLIQLLEFGFLPTISRYISYVFSGATEIKLNEVPIYETDGFVDVELLSGIIFSAKKIYAMVSIAALILVSFGGVFYLSTLKYSGDKFNIYLSWLIYGGASIVVFYFGYYNSILKGRGDQTKLNQSVVFSKLSGILVSIPLLYINVGLMSISIGVLVSAIVDRVLVRRFVLDKNANSTLTAFNLVPTKDYTAVIWGNAKLMGLVQLGNFLTIRSSVLIVSSIIGLEAAAEYGFTLQVTSVAVIISSMYFGLQLPLMNSAQVKNEQEIIREAFINSILVSWIMFLLYFVFTLFVGVHLIELCFDTARLLPNNILFFFLISAFLEMNHSLCTAYLTTKNQVVFMKSMLITGLSISICSIIFGFLFGLWGVVLSQFLLQLAYNNWKWPSEAFKDLDINGFSPFLIWIKKWQS